MLHINSSFFILPGIGGMMNSPSGPIIGNEMLTLVNLDVNELLVKLNFYLKIDDSKLRKFRTDL